MNSSKQSVAMTAIVGTLMSTSGKASESICPARRSLTNDNPPALPPRDPEPICVKRNVPSQNLRSKTGNSATRGLEQFIDNLRLRHNWQHLALPRQTPGQTLHCIARRRGTSPTRGRPPPSHPAPFVARLRHPANRDC